jgi:hypothetical protein
MPTETARQRYTRIACEVYASTPGNRSYARNDESDNALGVMAAAYHASGGSLDNDNRKKFGEFLLGLKPHIPSLFQDRPGEPKPMPKPWVDPVTGQPLPPPTDVKGKTLLRKYDPALADHYEAMERDPYGHIQQLHEREAQRAALAKIPYSSEQHETNPFRRNDKTAQAQFFKRDPDLAKFYQAEAKDVEIPLFGRLRNLTIEGRLAKDAATGALVKIAQRIHEDWREQDRIAAQEQRARAEAELKKLEASEDRRPQPRSIAMVG